MASDHDSGLFEQAPHYHGHRERLRARFRDAGADAVTDYELLELVLFRAIPQRDVKPLAKELIARFGSFAEVIAAPSLRLREIKGINGVHIIASGWDDFIPEVLTRAGIGRRPPRADEVQQSGTVDHTPVYPREVVKRALELSATALILVHNHPSGDPTPSRADIQMTQSIIDVAKPLGIAVHDHIIVGKEGHASLKGLKLI